MLAALIWFPIQVGLLVYWSRTRTAKSARAVWAGVAALVFVLIMQALVVTQRERILGVCTRIARAAEHGQVAEVVAHLSPRFAAGGYDHDGFAALVEQGLGRTHVERIGFSGFRTQAQGDATVVAEFDAVCHVERSGDYSGTVLTSWRVTFEKAGDSWRILHVEAVPRTFSPIHKLSDIGG